MSNAKLALSDIDMTMSIGVTDVSNRSFIHVFCEVESFFSSRVFFPPRVNKRNLLRLFEMLGNMFIMYIVKTKSVTNHQTPKA